MDKETHAFGILAVVFATISLPISASFIALGIWNRYEKKRAVQASCDMVKELVRIDHPGLRHIIGDEEFDRVRTLLLQQDK